MTTRSVKTSDFIFCWSGWRSFWPTIVVLLFILLRFADPVSATPVGDGSPLSIEIETGYQRSAVNYSLLLADTSSLSSDSLEQLEQAADTRTEPTIGFRLDWSKGDIRFNNRIYYAATGWQEQFDGRIVQHISPVWTFRAHSHLAFQQSADADDTLLVDYLTLDNDLRLSTRLSSSSVIRLQVDWDRLHYPGTTPSFGYNYDRLRSRIGLGWQGNDFDCAELTAGIGKRLVPDSADREYSERFVEGYIDNKIARNHRLLIDAAFQIRDGNSSDPGDDYTLISAEGRWEWGTFSARRLNFKARWNFWDFAAQDEVSFDFYELSSVVEFRLMGDDTWGIRFGPAYRLAAAADAQYALADYFQPFAILGLEYLPEAKIWLDVRCELGQRNYQESSLGYSDYTIFRFDTAADLELTDRLMLSAGLNFEKEFHDEQADNTDFLFFNLNLRYNLKR